MGRPAGQSQDWPFLLYGTPTPLDCSPYWRGVAENANTTEGVITMNKLIPTLGGSQCRYVRIPVKPSLIARISRMVKKAVRRG